MLAAGQLVRPDHAAMGFPRIPGVPLPDNLLNPFFDYDFGPAFRANDLSGWVTRQPPAIKQMIDVFEQVGGPVLAVERVPREQISQYGVIAPDTSVKLGEGIYQVKDLVEKPPVPARTVTDLVRSEAGTAQLASSGHMPFRAMRTRRMSSRSAVTRMERPFCDASTPFTYVPFGTPGTRSATFFHVFPPSRVTCRLPSCVPTHRTFASTGDSLIRVMVGYHVTP